MHIHKCIDMYTYISIHINKRRHIFVNTHTHLKTYANTGYDEAEMIHVFHTQIQINSNAHTHTYTRTQVALRAFAAAEAARVCQLAQLLI